MKDVLDFFRLSEAVPLVLLIFLLRFVGGQVAGEHTAPRWWARGFAAAGFIAYGILAVATWEPTTPSEFLTMGVQALLAMGMVHGLALITLPILRFLYVHLWATPLEHQRRSAEEQAREEENERQKQEAADREQAERERKAEEDRRKQEELANRPPPLTREQRVEVAKDWYEATLRLLASAGLDETELKAAQERAKQQYLREFDEVMK